MKASQLIKYLQILVDEGDDWEVATYADTHSDEDMRASFLINAAASRVHHNGLHYVISDIEGEEPIVLLY